MYSVYLLWWLDHNTNQNFCCQGECESDDECSSTQYCDDGSDKCKEVVCSPSDKCGQNAVCQVDNHRTKCICLPNFPAGDPYENCSKFFCILKDKSSIKRMIFNLNYQIINQLTALYLRTYSCAKTIWLVKYW